MRNDCREARVMDTVSENLKGMRRRVIVPNSIPGLVTDRVLVMTYLNGVPLTQLHNHASDLPEWKKKAAVKRVRCMSAQHWPCLVNAPWQAAIANLLGQTWLDEWAHVLAHPALQPL